MKLTRLCPAKVNLFLHIVGRKSNGYHDLQTLFCILNWGDTLTIQIEEFSSENLEPVIKISGMDQIPLEDNLIAKAIKAYTNATQLLGYEFNATISKKIPMGMGLGGGSSDAASCLLALNQLFDSPLSLSELQNIGCRLGADIPVFIQEKNAWAENIGDRLTPIELPNLHFLLVFPNEHVNTAQAFQNPDLQRENGALLKPKGQYDWKTYQHNHFEPVIRQQFPMIDKCFNILSKYGIPQLSGTGACVFICDEDFGKIEKIQQVLGQLYPDLKTQIASLNENTRT